MGVQVVSLTFDNSHSGQYDIAKRLSDAVPTSMKDMQADLQQKFKDIVQAGFAQFDLVTRQVFGLGSKKPTVSRRRCRSLVPGRNVRENEARI